MTYQSTGEVRAPKKGEYFLSFNPTQHYNARLIGHIHNEMEETIFSEHVRVIMVPVVETFDELSDN